MKKLAIFRLHHQYDVVISKFKSTAVHQIRLWQDHITTSEHCRLEMLRCGLVCG